jgi:hypothetical protein
MSFSARQILFSICYSDLGTRISTRLNAREVGSTKLASLMLAWHASETCLFRGGD